MPESSPLPTRFRQHLKAAPLIIALIALANHQSLRPLSPVTPAQPSHVTPRDTTPATPYPTSPAHLAHNLKVVGSNPAPATTLRGPWIQYPRAFLLLEGGGYSDPDDGR